MVNHLMQVVAAAAMEPPAGRGLDARREAQVGLLRSVLTG
jgi:glucose-6-phosphate 1-dehydrogenase